MQPSSVEQKVIEGFQVCVPERACSNWNMEKGIDVRSNPYFDQPPLEIGLIIKTMRKYGSEDEAQLLRQRTIGIRFRKNR